MYHTIELESTRKAREEAEQREAELIAELERKDREASKLRQRALEAERMLEPTISRSERERRKHKKALANKSRARNRR